MIRQEHNVKVKGDLTKRCYLFSLNIIHFLDTLPNNRIQWRIGDQLLRSATSIGANLVEATAASSKLEFKKFHEIALKSANETKYWLGLLRDAKKADKEVVNELLDEVIQIANMIASGILKMKGKR